MRALVLALGLFLAASAGAVTVGGPASSTQGACFTATWSGIASPTSMDWIGVYAVGAANTSYQAFQYTGGGASGSLSLWIPLTSTPGNYQLRLFSNNSYTLLATGTTFTVATPPNPSVSSGSTMVEQGGTVTVTWSNIPCIAATAADWIGLYTPGAASNPVAGASYWRYTTGAGSGSVPFTVPSGAALGTYEFRLFKNNTYTLYATSSTFSVVPTLSGTVTVSGSPLAGVSFSATNGGSCTTSNASGQYSCLVPNGWSGDVTPSIAGHVFTPASRTYSNVTASQAAQNFTATPAYTVSGTVTAGGSALANVAMAATNGASCTNTNASGQYTCTVSPGWSGTVTPSLIHNTFSPASRSYTSVMAAQSAQDYAATEVYKVSGSLTLNGLPLADVSLAATNGVTCSASNAIGAYSCTVPAGWSGTVTPAATGYSFSPTSRSYTSLVSDQTAQGFAATLDTATAPLYFVHVDHLNTPREIYDASQQLRWKWEQQEPFGVNVPDENPASLGAFEFALRFPGQYFDNETNLSYNLQRDYDSSAGRYVESDPLGLEAGLNTYGYVDATPLDSVDPSGLWNTKILCGNPANAAACAAAGMGGTVGGITSLVTNVSTQMSQMQCDDPIQMLGQIDWTQAAIATGMGMGTGIAMGPVLTAPTVMTLAAMPVRQAIAPVIVSVTVFAGGSSSSAQGGLSLLRTLMGNRRNVLLIKQASKKKQVQTPSK